MNETKRMTEIEIGKEIKESIAKGGYTKTDLILFIDEYGWADWMSEYCETKYFLSEEETEIINKIIETNFNNYFNI